VYCTCNDFNENLANPIDYIFMSLQKQGMVILLAIPGIALAVLKRFPLTSEKHEIVHLALFLGLCFKK